MVPTRATSREWAQYYERADRARALWGDPFRRLIERKARRARLVRVGLTVVATAALILFVWLAISWLGDASLQSTFGSATD